MRTAGTVGVVMCVLSQAASAQASIELGANVPATWAAGAGAPTIRTTVAPTLSLALGRRTGGATRVAIGAHFTNSTVRATEQGASWSGGTITLVDVVGTAAYTPSGTRLHRAAFEAGAGMVLVAGARDVAPFASARRVMPTVEATVVWSLPFTLRSGSTAAFVRGAFLRVGGRGTTDAVQQPGTVRRISAGARFTR